MTVRNRCFACMMLLLALPQTVQAEGIFSKGGPDAGTPEYYEHYSDLPVGSRQVYWKGKLWPPKPRPTGHKQLAVHKYHSAHYWPYPYVCQDRELVEATNFAQIENGWITATTFYDYHFDPDTQELNSSGRQHLRWMMSSVPEQFRNPYVTTTFEAHTTQARIASVETSVAALLGNDQSRPVATRVAQPLWRNANVVEMQLRGYESSLPSPTIEYQGVTAD